MSIPSRKITHHPMRVFITLVFFACLPVLFFSLVSFGEQLIHQVSFLKAEGGELGGFGGAIGGSASNVGGFVGGAGGIDIGGSAGLISIGTDIGGSAGNVIGGTSDIGGSAENLVGSADIGGSAESIIGGTDDIGGSAENLVGGTDIGGSAENVAGSDIGGSAENVASSDIGGSAQNSIDNTVDVGGSAGNVELLPETSHELLSSSPPLPACSLYVNPPSITPGGSATLSWDTSAAGIISIDHGIGSVNDSGSMVVSPTVTTEYTLTAANLGASILCHTTVTVVSPTPAAPSGGGGGGSPVPACPLSVSPNSLPIGGGEVTVSWTSSDTTSGSITGLSGTASLSGSAPTSVSSDTTFTGTFTGAGGTVSCTAAVTVATPSGGGGGGG